MIRRIIQLELVTTHRAPFAREAGRLNCRAVDTARAQHERQLSALAAAYRVGRPGPAPIVQAQAVGPRVTRPARRSPGAPAAAP